MERGFGYGAVAISSALLGALGGGAYALRSASADGVAMSWLNAAVLLSDFDGNGRKPEPEDAFALANGTLVALTATGWCELRRNT